MYASARKVVLLLTGIALLGGCAAKPKAASPRKLEALSTQLDEILHRGDGGNVVYGARVIDLSTGQELYSRNANLQVAPASNMKLPVSATFLDTFGPDHKFKTYLAVNGDDLWVIGTGDPAVGDPSIAKKKGKTVTMVLNDWADALASRGITQIKGKLYYYEDAFDDEWTHRDWSKGYLTDWYAAPVTGLNFNDNCVDVTVYPSVEGKPVNYTVVPPTSEIKIVNECVTGSGKEASIERDPAANVFTLKGATTKTVVLESKAVTDPGALFADALRVQLAARGIKIAGPTERARAPLDGMVIPPIDKVIATHETQLDDILWRILKNSQNLFAEAACKLSGQEYLLDTSRGYQRGSWASGQQAVKDFLGRQQIDSSALVLNDGSGLGRNNRVTVRIISDLLVAMHSHKYAKTFLDSLSVAGQDGTLAKRMKDLTGHVYGKTGYISGVRACSGYIKTNDGRWLVFSIIYNGINGSVSPYEKLQDEAIHVLVNWPDLKPATQPSTQPAVAVAN